jgi:hypothetical protein
MSPHVVFSSLSGFHSGLRCLPITTRASLSAPARCSADAADWACPPVVQVSSMTRYGLSRQRTTSPIAIGVEVPALPGSRRLQNPL